MKLLTKKIEALFDQYPPCSQDWKGMYAKVLVRYFSPMGTGTWIITEAARDGDDWLLYGYCRHILEWEWGSVRLSELQKMRLPFGVKLERDLYLPDDATVKDCLN